MEDADTPVRTTMAVCERCRFFRRHDVAVLVIVVPAQCEDPEHDPAAAAQRRRDFHDAYHTQGMKDAGNCGHCFETYLQ